ncbi:MAG: hypothetical protein HZA31_06470 [Opitutae bacterium]|nr:hypothetical protein [Opitutae bacterium]
MKTIRFALCLSLLAVATAFAAARHGDRAAIRAILISASPAAGETDRSLAAYEPTLRRLLRFESFRRLGEGSATLTPAKPSQLSLGNGQQLELTSESAEGRSLRVRVNWTANGRSLMNTALVLQPGVPAVLGGPAHGRKGDVYAVLVIAQ